MIRLAVWAACVTVYAVEFGAGLDYTLRALFGHVQHPAVVAVAGGCLASFAAAAAVLAVRRASAGGGR